MPCGESTRRPCKVRAGPWGERCSRSPLALPQPLQLPWGRGTRGCHHPVPRHRRARAGLTVRVLVPVTLGTCPPAELRRAHEQEKLLLAESHHRSQEALQVPREKPPGTGCPRRTATGSPACHRDLAQPWGYRGAPARAGNPDTPRPASSPAARRRWRR